MTLKVIGMEARALWYIRKDTMATGPHILSIQGLYLPFFPGFDLSQILPMVTSVKASTNLAIIMIMPTMAAFTPIMSV